MQKQLEKSRYHAEVKKLDVQMDWCDKYEFGLAAFCGAMAGFMGMGAGMNFGGGFMGAASASNLQQMQMQQKLMQMQQEMAKAQQEVEEATFTASVGGGAVSAAANGKKEITALTIKPEAVDPEDVEMLQDLVISAVNEALRQADDAMSSRMNSFTSGLNIPGLGL